VEPNCQLSVVVSGGTHSSAVRGRSVVKFLEGLLFACLIAFVLITIAGQFG
jgi:hypothetical protein